MAQNENEAPDYWAEEYRRVHNWIRKEWVCQKEELAELRAKLAAEQRAAEKCFKMYERELAHLKAKLDEKDRLLLESAKVLYKSLHG
jgi:ribosomal protein L29